MSQLTRPVQLFIGFAMMVFGPFWASVAHFMKGSGIAYIVGAYFFGFGLALVLFGPRWALCFGVAVAFGFAGYLAQMLIGDAA